MIKIENLNILLTIKVEFIMEKLKTIGLSPLKAGEECNVNGGKIRNPWIVCCRDIGTEKFDFRSENAFISINK